MENILLTVIITVYNVELYISQCIESIIGQTYKNLEIIIVDDGSTDTSAQICDKYAGRDKRIITIHKKNEGVVSARYQGIKRAKGSLITFVDGDDWLEQDMYENLISSYMEEKPDLVVSGLTFEWEDHREILFDHAEEGIYEKESIEKNILPRWPYIYQMNPQGVMASVCNKLFRDTLLKEIIDVIDLRLTLGEDGAIVYSFIKRANKIKVIHKSWYHYRQRTASANRTFGLTAFEKLYRLKKCLENGFHIWGFGNEMEHQINMYVGGFLTLAVEDVYGISLGGISYLFPYESVPQNSKIIIYGAGKVGHSYWKCIQYGKYAELVAWVDKEYETLQYYGLPVESLEKAVNKSFDYIIIAIEKRETADKIRADLLNYNIQKDRIVWKVGKKIF